MNGCPHFLIKCATCPRIAKQRTIKQYQCPLCIFEDRPLPNAPSVLMGLNSSNRGIGNRTVNGWKHLLEDADYLILNTAGGNSFLKRIQLQ